MNKFCGFLFIGVLCFCGCGGNSSLLHKQVVHKPDFMVLPPMEKGFIFGIGITDQSNPVLAQETADLRARKEIAKILSARVSFLVQGFMKQYGVGTQAEAAEFAKSISRTISEIGLANVEIVKREYVGHTMYSLGRYPLNDSMCAMIGQIVRNALMIREPLLSQFEQKHGFVAISGILQQEAQR